MDDMTEKDNGAAESAETKDKSPDHTASVEPGTGASSANQHVSTINQPMDSEKPNLSVESSQKKEHYCAFDPTLKTDDPKPEDILDLPGSVAEPTGEVDQSGKDLSMLSDVTDESTDDARGETSAGD